MNTVISQKKEMDSLFGMPGHSDQFEILKLKFVNVTVIKYGALAKYRNTS